MCQGSKFVKVCEVEAVPEVTILNVNSDSSNRIICAVQISVPESESQDIKLKLHTGSAVSILPESVVTEYFSEASLLEPKIKRLREMESYRCEGLLKG